MAVAGTRRAILEAALLVAVRDAGQPLPAAAVLMSPTVDLTSSGASMTERADQDPFSSPALLRQLASDYLAGADPKTPLASPLAYGISAGRLAGPVCRLLRQVPKLSGLTVSRCEQIMPEMHRLADVGFHAGELAVQHRAGVEAQAARLARMLEPVELDGGIARFLAGRTFAALTGRDDADRLWVTPLTGPPGFLNVTSLTTLEVGAVLAVGDPLHGLPAAQQVGLVVVEFAARRRVRINGTLIQAGPGRLVIKVEQAYGNCPQYIQQRVLISGYRDQAGAGDVRYDNALASEDIELIRGADTFFLGTTHPERGSDASHRGGPSGFVRVDGDQLWWPDYPGNNLFNSFGNLAINPETALLFLDFTTGRTLQLTGAAAIEWGEPGRPGDDGHTGRRVRFTLRRLVADHLLAARQSAHSPYPRNPDLTDLGQARTADRTR